MERVRVMITLPTKILLVALLALGITGYALYLQVHRNGELTAANDTLATIVATQARDAIKQGKVLESHQRERARLFGENETTKAQLREAMRGRDFAGCVVPDDIRLRINAGADQANATTGNTDRADAHSPVLR